MTEDSQKPSYDLTQFEVTRILNNNTNRKLITVLGKFKNLSEDDLGIVLLEKQAFTESQLVDNTFFNADVKLQQDFVNDIYGNFQLTQVPELNSKTF